MALTSLKTVKNIYLTSYEYLQLIVLITSLLRCNKLISFHELEILIYRSRNCCFPLIPSYIFTLIVPQRIQHEVYVYSKNMHKT